MLTIPMKECAPTRIEGPRMLSVTVWKAEAFERGSIINSRDEEPATQAMLEIEFKGAGEQKQKETMLTIPMKEWPPVWDFKCEFPYRESTSEVEFKLWIYEIEWDEAASLAESKKIGAAGEVMKDGNKFPKWSVPFAQLAVGEAMQFQDEIRHAETSGRKGKIRETEAGADAHVFLKLSLTGTRFDEDP